MAVRSFPFSGSDGEEMKRCRRDDGRSTDTHEKSPVRCGGNSDPPEQTRRATAAGSQRDPKKALAPIDGDGGLEEHEHKSIGICITETGQVGNGKY